jgi:hypothetical protein
MLILSSTRQHFFGSAVYHRSERLYFDVIRRHVVTSTSWFAAAMTLSNADDLQLDQQLECHHRKQMGKSHVNKTERQREPIFGSNTNMHKNKV